MTINLNASFDNFVQDKVIQTVATNENKNADVIAGLTALINKLSQAVEQSKSSDSSAPSIFPGFPFSGVNAEQTLETLQKLLDSLLKSSPAATSPNTENPNNGEGPSNSLLISMLSSMSGAMNELSGIVAQSSSEKQKTDATIAQAMIKQAQDALAKAQEQQREIEAQKAAQNAMSIFMKVIEAVVAVVVSAVALAFGQVQVAVIAMTMMIMQESGALDKISGAIAQSLIKDGMSPENAKIVADMITTVMVIVVSCMGSFASGMSTVARTAATKATTSAASLAEKAAQVLTKLNLFNRLSPAMNTVIFATTQSIMQTNLVADATVAVLTAEHKDANEIAQAQMIAQIVSSVLLSITSAGSMAGMMSTGNAIQSASANSSKLAKLLESLRGTVPANVLSNLSTGAQWVGGGLEAGAQLGMGISLSKQADAEMKIGEAKASADFFNNLTETTNAGMLSTQRAAANVIKSHQDIDAEVNKQMLAGQAEFVKIFAQAV